MSKNDLRQQKRNEKYRAQQSQARGKKEKKMTNKYNFTTISVDGLTFSNPRTDFKERLPGNEQKKKPDGPSVKWEDIIGLELAKEALREAIEYPLTHANLYAAYNKQPSRGVLLYGPPGCGKTMLAKAVATAMGSLAPNVQRSSRGLSYFQMEEAKPLRGFISIKGSEVLGSYVGQSEATVRSLFSEAREFHKSTGQRAVIFIDEAEAILSCRSSSRSWLSSMLVPTFLAEMDGVEDSGAFVVLSTNRVNELDSAITRDGRIDVKVEVTRPNRDDARKIFETNLRNVPLSGDGLVDSVCRDIFSGAHAVASGSLDGSTVSLYLDEVLSGAVIAGITKRAIAKAIQRDREAGATTPTGVTEQDFGYAVSRAAIEMKDLNWRDELLAKAVDSLKSNAVHDVAKLINGAAN